MTPSDAGQQRFLDSTLLLYELADIMVQRHVPRGATKLGLSSSLILETISGLLTQQRTQDRTLFFFDRTELMDGWMVTVLRTCLDPDDE